MILLVVSIAPVYAQNTHSDEQEEKIWQEILECEKKFAEDKDMTEAEKTVNKRNCSSEIRSLYAEKPLTAKALNELKIKQQNLQRCNDWHASYKFLDEATFRLQKNAQMVTSCIALYNDPLWAYDGVDREQILVEKLDQIMSETPVKTNLSDEFLKDSQREFNTIENLEKRILELENNLKNKDMIIQEQMNVIVNLVKTMKNVLFDGIQSMYSHLV
ncbi:MAG: hypothetical protein ACE5GR_05040 [Nitrosopumilus sp.]